MRCKILQNRNKAEQLESILTLWFGHTSDEPMTDCSVNNPYQPSPQHPLAISTGPVICSQHHGCSDSYARVPPPPYLYLLLCSFQSSSTRKIPVSHPPARMERGNQDSIGPDEISWGIIIGLAWVSLNPCQAHATDIYELDIGHPSCGRVPPATSSRPGEKLTPIFTIQLQRYSTSYNILGGRPAVENLQS